MHFQLVFPTRAYFACVCRCFVAVRPDWAFSCHFFAFAWAIVSRSQSLQPDCATWSEYLPLMQGLHANWFVLSLKVPFAQLTHEPMEVSLYIPWGQRPHERASQRLVLKAKTSPPSPIKHLLGETHGGVVLKPTIVSDLVVNKVVTNETEPLALLKIFKPPPLYIVQQIEKPC